VPDRALRLHVRRHVEFEDLAEAIIPLHVVAFDVIEGREVLLSDGPALDAIAAAAALPGVFPPVQIGESCLIDGGVVNNTPISHAVELGAERIYVLPTQERWTPLGRAPRGALDTAIYGLGVLVNGRLKAVRGFSRARVCPSRLEPPRGDLSTRPSTSYTADRCVRARPNRPFRGGSRRHRTHLQGRVLPRCCHGPGPKMLVRAGGRASQVQILPPRRVAEGRTLLGSGLACNPREPSIRIFAISSRSCL
jgi:predicted acylesterase/phospholipase RssA